MIHIYISSCIKSCKLKVAGVIAISVIMSVFAHSCIEHNNYGYPSAVYFTEQGGVKIANGTIPISHLEILHIKSGECLASTYYNDLDTLTLKYSSISATHDWIDVRQDYGSTQLQITVAPLEDKKTRKVFIEGRFVDEYAVIEIIQEAK